MAAGVLDVRRSRLGANGAVAGVTIFMELTRSHGKHDTPAAITLTVPTGDGKIASLTFQVSNSDNHVVMPFRLDG